MADELEQNPQDPEVNKATEGDSQDLQDLRAELLSQLVGKTKAPRTTGINLNVGSALSGIGKWAMYLFAAVLVIATGWFLWSAWQTSTGEVVLVVTPNDASVKVDGRDRSVASGESRLKLRAGKHELEVSKEGFRTESRSFEVIKKQSQTVQIALRTVPTLQLLAEQARFARVSSDGKYLAYYDASTAKFIRQELEANTPRELFGGHQFADVEAVTWSPSLEQAIVRLKGEPRLVNAQDNRAELGKFVPLGERPQAGPTTFAGFSTWLFDNTRNTAAGWQPVRLTDGMRKVGFSIFGDKIIYFYEGADGEKAFFQALPDGKEWERIVSGVGDFRVDLLDYGANTRYVVIKAGQGSSNRLMVLDRVSRELVDLWAGQVEANVNFYWAQEGEQIWFLESGQVKRWSFRESKFIDPITLGRGLIDIVPGSSESIGLDADGNLWEIAQEGEMNPLSFIGNSDELKNADLLYASTVRYLFGLTPAGQIWYMAI